VHCTGWNKPTRIICAIPRASFATEKDPQMSHSKTPSKTKVARARSRAKRPAKPGPRTRVPAGMISRR
jgi:hypothetical protein